MHARFSAFARAFRSPEIWARLSRPSVKPWRPLFVCRRCQNQFSTSSVLRQVAKTLKNSAKSASNKKYPEKLAIYQAGDMRTSFVAFWKGTAMFQFSVVCIFIVPMVYKNENQPDPNIRLVQAAGLLFLSAMPIVTLSYVTTPFVKTVFINLPSTARLSRDSLARFSKRLPPDTLLEFTTLRAFPFQRNTAVMLSELQALKPQWWRFANIERVKTKEFERLQRQKSLWRRLLQIVNEPRFKFYVKEGRNYTIRTGVPGVWENVARAIQKQTVLDGGKEAKEMARLVKEVQIRNIKRQTTRSTR